MRADRLVATLLFMQTRGRVTAAEVAAELEVSVATARRDLEALSAAGVPVCPQPGRHGGWSLVGGARTDLSGLSAAEARALFLLTGPAAVSGTARTALRKLLRALPAPFRADAEAAAGATLIDPAGWGERAPETPEAVALLQEAVVARRRIRFVYRGRGEDAERVAEPWGVIDKSDIHYLVAGTVNGRRTFRVDRMSRVVVTGETFERPADLDLDAAWDEVVGEVERMRSRTSATLLVDRRFVWVLRDHFGRHCEVAEILADGRARVRVGAPEPRDIARTLAGWGAAVEVLDPPAVRAELARIGAELAGLYRQPGSACGSGGGSQDRPAREEAVPDG
ncbi:transcriptional regulator [Actinoplanes philippinensis]|uniref:Predicted DNA-binding transcriptional regulator YafY, contains an HTH and WYL domains n=1 Tax=Actinoplanes philippinensis TaxID=35752 RepID=A0A1I2MNK1_9ACTN|nr:WYL domain-containing protein [Actinoplanes philippinensis]GIE83212.1 transcriptional regulator [Actinoplanes philippinensis]SFF93155.1 Predicted DNA-binding transcriptional regulator YafY, contains an HTH and WYL domains [Actinoplanes philippinensis]